MHYDVFLKVTMRRYKKKLKGGISSLTAKNDPNSLHLAFNNKCFLQGTLFGNVIIELKHSFGSSGPTSDLFYQHYSWIRCMMWYIYQVVSPMSKPEKITTDGLRQKVFNKMSVLTCWEKSTLNYWLHFWCFFMIPSKKCVYKIWSVTRKWNKRR